MSFLPEGTIKKCWNKRCACRNINKEYKCDRYLKAPKHKCRKFVSFENRKSVNKPNQMKGNSMHNRQININFKTSGIEEIAKNLRAISNKLNKQDNSYTFRGEININHVINDCVKDQKNCFVAIGKKEAILGISRQLPVKDKVKLTNQLKGSYEDDVIKSFYIIDFELKDVSFVVSELPKISKLIKKQIMKNTKILKKQMKKDWDNQLPETKVMVY